MPARFSGHPYSGGLFVLDTWTGEVVKVPEDGSPPTILRPAVLPAGGVNFGVPFARGRWGGVNLVGKGNHGREGSA